MYLACIIDFRLPGKGRNKKLLIFRGVFRSANKYGLFEETLIEIIGFVDI